ncbi:MAG TPA: glycosyltransferase family 2 protein [Thermodesulfobacteriota bacterium]|jgi:glycosyltransferase involved in cell wall biosynthesis|nr:glycosyltransferase family 2 protein [Thermodesulfobacteriota bacterium]
MQSFDKICILIPAYNAQETLGSVLRKVEPLKIDIIVVDDGSSDETKRISSEMGVHLLSHPVNLGKGAALRTGFQYILQKDYEVVITLDADGQHNPSEIPFLLRIFQNVKPDILIASRAAEFGKMTFLRRFWNRLGVKAVARLCHSDITDSQSGFRLIRTSLLKEVNLSTSHFETELELLIKACKKGFSMLSIPINTQKVDGTSSTHFRPVADTWRVCKLFLRSLLW